MQTPRSVRPEVRQAVFALVRQIPKGQLASYGMIASLLEGVTARMVGHALRGAEGAGVPWQRVINASGTVSAHEGSMEQRDRLMAEGIDMSAKGRIRWAEVRWHGPDPDWVADRDMDPIRLTEIMASWPG